MLAKYFKSPVHVLEMQSRPCGDLLEKFAEALSQIGYADGVSRSHLRTAEHFVYWAYREGIPQAGFGSASLDRFNEHLASCQCYGMRRRRSHGSSYGAQLFLDIGVCVERTRSTVLDSEPGEELFLAFSQWMHQHRGTSELTLYNYGNALRSMLKYVGNDQDKLTAAYLRQFILEQSNQKGVKAAKRSTTALRMFLRFLVAEGKCSAALLGAIPVVANWRLSSLPKYLQESEVERVIDSCNLSSPVGRRDRAILLLLARLGLRAGDVLRLRLSDIDWPGASIKVSGKGRQEVLLPLTQEVGLAIVEYLQTERPQTTTDTVFVRSRAPFREFANHCAVSALVERAMCRAGISCQSRGAAHVLRHSAATSMLRNGASLQDIAKVLRHRSVATTQIYAKVDTETLKEVVQPWPAEASC